MFEDHTGEQPVIITTDIPEDVKIMKEMGLKALSFLHLTGQEFFLMDMEE